MRRSLVILCLTTIPTSPSAQSAIDAPAALLTAVRGEPLAAAISLVDASIPIGLEIKSPIPSPRRPVFDLSRHATVPVTTLVGAFNASHVDYRAAFVDGVFVIRPTGSTAAYLDTATTLEAVNVTGAMNAARMIFSGLDRRLSSTGGVAGSSINADPVERGDLTVVALTGYGRRVIDMLNQLAAQSGSGWLVVTAREGSGVRVRTFGLIHRHGSITRVDISDAQQSNR